MPENTVSEPLVCCRCDAGRLETTAEELRCVACDSTYPILGEIPCLVPDPAIYRHGWHARVGAYVTAIEERLREISLEREADELPRRTRERLLRVLGALHTQRRAVETLMAPMLANVGQTPLAALSSHPAFAANSDAAAPLAVLQHYENIFRDWAWGQEENDRQRDMLQRLIPSSMQEIHRIAIYGSGAGRLAVDLHQHLLPKHTFGLDLNPLPLIVGDQLLRGTSLSLPEFPLAPRAEEKVVVLHQLTSPLIRPGVTFMFADALRPPFAAGSLDVVVTPWFIDVVDVDLGTTAAAINRVLRRGGLWLNLGPLMFKGSVGNQHAIEEVLDIVRDSGFELLSNGSEDVPYYRSPHSGSSRVETVFWYSARKIKETPVRERRAPVGTVDPAGGNTEPPWLSDPNLPVPLQPQLAQVHRSSVMTIGVLSMIDGQRSITDMAARLAQSWNAEPSAVRDHLRAFFMTFFK
ncbi:MAG: methyltransferase domain-containing protein [Deltaproteobacteria bacterium]|nr:methyltransferase domain-containing protein [Deltaproteobacteria bacterium]